MDTSSPSRDPGIFIRYNFNGIKVIKDLFEKRALLIKHAWVWLPLFIIMCTLPWPLGGPALTHIINQAQHTWKKHCNQPIAWGIPDLWGFFTTFSQCFGPLCLLLTPWFRWYTLFVPAGFFFVKQGFLHWDLFLQWSHLSLVWCYVGIYFECCGVSLLFVWYTWFAHINHKCSVRIHISFYSIYTFIPFCSVIISLPQIYLS